MQPNVLILLADQHRFSSTRLAGNPDVITPNLDRLAKHGVSARHCISSHPLCAPYRACLQTGQPASVNGVKGNRDNIDRSLPTLAQQFKRAGYATAYFGKCHWHESIDGSKFTPSDWRLGWDHWQGWQNGHEDTDLPTFDENGKQLHEFAGRFAPEVQTEQLLSWHEQTDGPWIAQMNWGPPHNATISEKELEKFREPSRKINEELGLGLEEHHFQNPWWWVQSFPQHLVKDVVPQRFLELFDVKELKLDPNIRSDEKYQTLIRYQLKEYYAQIAALDHYVGSIISRLEERGDLENTLILYTSDHGDWIGSNRSPEQNCRGKGDWQQSSLRVPFVLSGPKLPPDKTVDLPISTLDLLPTLCGLAGIEAVGNFPGSDLSSFLRDEQSLEKRIVIAEKDDWRSAYDGSWIYTERAVEEGWESLAFIHTATDPYDLDNQVNSSKCASKQMELSNHLKENQ